MKSKNIYLLSTTLIVLMCATIAGCTKEWKDKVGAGPVLTISDTYKEITGINVGDQVTIPVTATSPSGVKRIAYYFINRTANGTESGSPTFIDRDDFPTELTVNVTFTVQPQMTELVITSFNKDNFASEVHIPMSEIRGLPTLTFKDGIDFRETVFENKVIRVEGEVNSAYDLKSLSYQTISNGTASAETAIAFTNKRSTPFLAEVTVANGLSAVVIKAVNIHDGMISDTFRIGSVEADAVSISIGGGLTALDVVYADSLNTFTGLAVSGSAIETLTYAIKKNGSYGAEQQIPIGAVPDEFSFDLSFEGENGIEAIRLSGENAGGKSQVIEFPVTNVYNRLLHFTNITLTTEVGPGKNNWFSAYQAPHVFDVTNAAANQEMLDFAFIKYTATANRIVPAAVYNASTAYRDATAPYMVGFTKAPYTMVTANRPHINPEEFNSLGWDGEMNTWLQQNIVAPTNQGGENYNVAVANRRVSGDMVPGAGFVIGWGSWNFADGTVNNQAFGLVIVKEYTVNGDFATVTLDIKVPAENVRTKFNPVSIFSYP